MQYISEIDRLSSYPSIDTEVLRTFVAIADQGGFTRAGEQVNRTQSAVSMQMKRLEEDVLQRKLFERDGRQVRLTPEGQVLLGYARRILKLHSEVFNTLREPHMVGLVRIGTPDDYVMRYLPGILKRFSKAYPLIQIEMHCESSPILMQRRDLALTVISREPGNEMGELLRNERMVWVAAPCFCLDDHSALPLAISGMDSFCTEFRFRNPETGNLDGGFVPVDFAMSAAAYGCKTYKVNTVEQLQAALADARTQTVSTLIDIKVLPKTMIHGYLSWWRVGVAQVSTSERTNAVAKQLNERLAKARQY